MTTANAMTVDVEDYFHVAALAGAIRPAQWDDIAPRVEDSTRRLLDMFDAAGVSGTFFVLGWVAERFPGLVTEIDRRGHEVGCHGFSHQLIYKQTPEVFRQETFRAKALLEDTIGKPVIGYRAASYSITSASLWALDTILDAGFHYDSSIVPAKHDLYGIPDTQPTPHVLNAPSGRELLEFPPSTLPVLGRSIPIGGGGYFRIYPYWLTRHFLRRFAALRSAPFIFYLHPWEVDPEQPTVDVSGLSRFRHYFNLRKTEQRLAQLLKDFRFDTVRHVLTGTGLLKPAN